MEALDDDTNSDDWVLSEVYLNPNHGPHSTSTHLRTSIFTSSSLPGPISISHRMATPLQDVGLQLWAGSLILAEYLILRSKKQCGSQKEAMDRCYLDLGAGLGFVSIVAAMCDSSSVVYATDLEHVLDLCEKNVLDNGASGQVHVRSLDFMDEGHPLIQRDADMSSHSLTQKTEGLGQVKWQWSQEDIQMVLHRDLIILAADVVYDNSVTFAFIRRLFDLLSHTTYSTTSNIPPKRILYMSLERRIQFSLDDLDVKAPGQDFFFDTLEAMNADREERSLQTISYRQISLEDIPQWYDYTRSEHLQMWMFWSGTL